MNGSEVPLYNKPVNRANVVPKVGAAGSCNTGQNSAFSHVLLVILWAPGCTILSAFTGLLYKGTSDPFMNSYLTSKMSSFCVANLVNSQLLPAIRALNLNILNRNLLRSE